MVKSILGAWEMEKKNNKTPEFWGWVKWHCTGKKFMEIYS